MNGHESTNSEIQSPKDLNEMIEKLEEELETEENYFENMKNIYKIALKNLIQRKKIIFLQNN